MIWGSTMQAPISKLGLLPSAPELHRPHQHTRGDKEYRQGVELAQPLERAQACLCACISSWIFTLRRCCSR